ncbi:hypothetical protein [Rhizobium sp. CIAT894]|uniref:hypothetical protein n=1 Tax=Rhizobium sp. CIAT894 TaxID=2020312 RepID=UPI0013DDE831|nr:hypothetical protein [Rhizobium sp. CIAT894]
MWSGVTERHEMLVNGWAEVGSSYRDTGEALPTLAIDWRAPSVWKHVQDIGGVPVICDEKINAPEGA